METLGYYKRIGSSRVLRHVGYDENNDFLMTMLFEDRAHSTRKCDIERDWQKLDDFDISKIERQTCGRRIGDFGPWSRENNIDYWENDGGSLDCSFCGSQKFEVLLEVIDKVIEGVKGYHIEHSTKGYKIYMDTPGKGHLKFYTHHMPKMSDEELKAFNDKFVKAKVISNDKFMKMLKDRSDKLVNESNKEV